MVVDEWIENILAQIKIQGYADILDKNRQCIIKCLSPEEYDKLLNKGERNYEPMNFITNGDN
jgi:hypothetical protein